MSDTIVMEGAKMKMKDEKKMNNFNISEKTTTATTTEAARKNCTTKKTA